MLLRRAVYSSFLVPLSICNEILEHFKFQEDVVKKKSYFKNYNIIIQIMKATTTVDYY